MRNKRIQMLVEIAIMVAFAYVLSLFRVGRLPQGGSISLQMLPIFVIALKWGGIPGVIAGLLFSGIKLITDPFIVHPLQAILDYPLAFAAIGVAGFLKGKPLVAILVGGMSRFFLHFLAGIVFFGSYAPEGQSVFIYSIVYNMTYMGPEILVALLTAPMVMIRLTPEHAKEYNYKNNLIEILSFVAPLAAMALVVGLRKSIPIINQAALVLWIALAGYHLFTAIKDFKAAKRGLLLVSVPPAVVYVAHLIIDSLS